ncbi:MAG: small conductance mechanosensitive channel [Rhodothermales bacterium]|jgi:small conductance mechanosensitive channel
MEGIDLLATLTDLLTRFGGRVVGSIAILIIGLFVAKRVRILAAKASRRSELDETGIRFVGNIVYYLLASVVVLIAINNLGVEISAILAALGAAGLAVGLALTGAVTNLAAGLIIAVLRPFSIGDFIEAGDVEGKITDIDVFSTTLLTLDNETIIVPNADLVGGAITNYSAEEYVRVEVPLEVSVEADLEKMAPALLEAALSCDRVLPEPVPEVQIVQFGAASVSLQLEVTVQAKDREDVVFDVNRAISGPYREGQWAPKRLLRVSEA